jgi:serine/threonine protein kinase/tetratricopeptide (TPR) repeat protein
MPNEPLSRIEILYEACQISCPEERRRYLDRVCGGDAHLRDEIEADTEYAPYVDDILSETALEMLQRARELEDDDELEDLTSEVLGDYRIVGRIGRGGFAIVHEAEPLQGTGAHVAIKVIKLGMDSREVLARFRREHALMAQLNHPNIAKSESYGISPHGRAYVVMELVEGEPITEYCDHRKLSIRARIELLLTVCDAIITAHTLSIIHRDLKPSNILVTEVDGQPVAKVIDFGIAKALNSDFGFSTLHTRSSQIIGTPCYMSPEQAQLGGICGASSDQYALAAVLHELIAGVSHLGLNDSQMQSRSEVMKRLTEGEAVRPSLHLSKLNGSTLEGIAAKRSTGAAGLIPQINGELESILFQALQRDPARRYASVAEFAANLRAHLDGQRVVGTRPTFFYVLRNVARDYRRETILASLFLLVLTATTVFSIFMAVKADKAQKLAIANEMKAETALGAERQARRNESRQRQEALAAAQREMDALRKVHDTEEINVALGSELMSAAATGPGRLDELTFREALNHAAQGVVPRYADRPLVQAALLEAIARAQLSMSAFIDAESHVSRALDLRRSHQGPDHADTVNTEILLVQAYFGTDKYLAAEPLVKHIRACLLRRCGPDHRDTIHAEYFWTACLAARSEFEMAKNATQSALRRAQAVLDANDVLTCQFELQLAAMCQHLGQLDEAEQLYLEALAHHRHALGDENPLTLSCQSRLADVYNVRKQFNHALPFYEATLGAQRRLLGVDFHETLVTELHLASVYMHLGQFAAAESLFLETLPKQERVMGTANSLTLKTQANLAELYERQGRQREAEMLYEDALQRMEDALGPDHSHTVVTMHKLGLLKHRLNNLVDAEMYLRRTLERTSRCEGAEHRHVLELECELAAVLRDQQRFSDAEALFAKALEAQRRTLGERHANTLTTLHEFALLHLAQGKPQVAEPLLQEAAAGRRDTLGADHRETLATEAQLRSITPPISPLTDTSPATNP